LSQLTKTQNSKIQLTLKIKQTNNSSMQLSSLFILCSLALFQEGCSSATSALKVREGFFSQGEVSLFSSVTPTYVDPLGRPTGEVELPVHIMHRFHAEKTSKYDALSHCSVFPQKVNTKLLMASSSCHTDAVMPHNGQRSEQAEEDTKIVGHVRFVFLNDNEDAFFKHGEEQVPVVAGNLVTFPGDVPHSTIVNSGEVYLLDPFDEHFSPIAYSLMHVVPTGYNRFIRQRKLDDAVDGDAITFESTNSTNSTDLFSTC
jgi:hypothetical protein